MNPTENILEARDIQVIRGGTLLLDIPSLLIQEGEVLSLIGPNGAGKTTLLQALSYLQKPSQGEILVRGERIQPNHSRSVIEERSRWFSRNLSYSIQRFLKMWLLA